MRIPSRLALPLLLVAGAVPSDAAEVVDLDAALQGAVESTGAAAAGLVEDDRLRVHFHLDGAADGVAAAVLLAQDGEVAPALGRKGARARKAIEKFSMGLADAREAAADPGESAWYTAKALRRAAKMGSRALRILHRSSAAGFSFREARAGAGGAYSPGRRAVLRLFPGVDDQGGPCGEAVDLELLDDGPGSSVDGALEDLGRGRYRVTMGPDFGTARVVASACGVKRTLFLFNTGPGGALRRDPGWGESGEAPAMVSLPSGELRLRVGVPVSPQVPAVTGGIPDVWTVAPALPGGLTLDPATGVLSGTPLLDLPTATFTVSAVNLHGSAGAPLSLQVTPPLPPGMEELEEGFVAEPFLEDLLVPVKMARAPDGRIFFNELMTGNIRVVNADGNLVPTPFATVNVLTGGERGLLGLALAPDFATSGHLFVYAIAPGAGPQAERGQVIRFTAAGNAGTGPVVVIDDLPAGVLSNGGDIQFGPEGSLYVSVGDTGNSLLAQADGELAGRILRFAEDGSIPADNPDPASPEWARGLRNSFDMAFDPETGVLFATENGPTAGDEVNFILKGRNYGWESLPDDFPGPLVGLRIAWWGPVIVPTGAVLHSGSGFGAAYSDNLFLCGYDEADLRRLVLSGPFLTDLDEEVPFARWNDDGSVGNKPLDILELPGGDLLVSTFSGIWRIRPYE